MTPERIRWLRAQIADHQAHEAPDGEVAWCGWLKDALDTVEAVLEELSQHPVIVRTVTLHDDGSVDVSGPHIHVIFSAAYWTSTRPSPPATFQHRIRGPALERPEHYYYDPRYYDTSRGVRHPRTDMQRPKRCCSHDTDGDGDCPIHSAPGVTKAKARVI